MRVDGAVRCSLELVIALAMDPQPLSRVATWALCDPELHDVIGGCL